MILSHLKEGQEGLCIVLVGGEEGGEGKRVVGERKERAQGVEEKEKEKGGESEGQILFDDY